MSARHLKVRNCAHCCQSGSFSPTVGPVLNRMHSHRLSMSAVSVDLPDVCRRSPRLLDRQVRPTTRCSPWPRRLAGQRALRTLAVTSPIDGPRSRTVGRGRSRGGRFDIRSGPEKENVKADRPRRVGVRSSAWFGPVVRLIAAPCSLYLRAIPQSVDRNVATTLPALESASSLPETRKASTEASALARLLSSSIRAGSPAIFVLTSDPMVTDSSMRA